MQIRPSNDFQTICDFSSPTAAMVNIPESSGFL